jgi:hypothetical protein
VEKEGGESPADREDDCHEGDREDTFLHSCLLPAFRVGIHRSNCVKIENEEGNHPRLVGILAEENSFHSFDEDFQVKNQRPVLDVVDVESGPLRD